MHPATNKYLISALLIGIGLHSTTIFFTLEATYDALIHLFFGSHYAQSWFEPWNYSWYTGFTVLGYPPLVHQCIGMLSYLGGLKFGLFVVAFLAIILFITGVYRYALVLTADRKIAGYTAILGVFSSAFIETLHLFGQLPSIVGIALLLHALPEIYLWVKNGTTQQLVKALSLIAVTVCSHHVTPIFGMVFFIFPLLGLVVMDAAMDTVRAQSASYSSIRLGLFFRTFLRLLKRMLVFGFGSLFLITFCILPYWINTKNNPITQVPIPHGSRDHFLEVTSSGLVFFLIPWGILLLLMPYLWYRFFCRRYLFFGLSFVLLSVLGTGGTTPIARMILGENAFNILTLDRFTLWASLMALPIFGEFSYRLIEGDLKTNLVQKFGGVWFRIQASILALVLIGIGVFTICLGYFRPLQPQSIAMLPIVNFLKQDQHDHWRYLPLGFGDQMAWLSAQTNAMTVDGNYHSARRLPELTSRAVERLENSKFRGIEGIGSLQQFLTVPEKYKLKYVFSNDKFYDPLLFFCGWQRLRQLENGIMVWEKLQVPPLSKYLPKEDVPLFQKILWGLMPLSALCFAFLSNIQSIWFRALKSKIVPLADYLKYKTQYRNCRPITIWISYSWALLLIACMGFGLYFLYQDNESQIRPKNVVKAYYDALDFKAFQRAYSYISPKSGKTLEQFMLEIAVSDGLLSSYAKLDALQIKLIYQTATSAKARVTANWITPLDKRSKTYTHQLSKENGKWYMLPNPIEKDLPPDQFFTTQNVLFYNHGRRRISTQKTYHEDVLKQPEIEILSASLVQNNDSYHVVGSLQNIAAVPADIRIRASLYAATNHELASYNAKDLIKHKLMPKESSSFRIDFEGVAWKHNTESKPATFDPNMFTDIYFREQPTKFVLHCGSHVATKDLYKSVAINDIRVEQNQIRGVLFNSGLHEVTIPQLIISYFDENQKIIWVSQHYLEEGIRPQRKQFFELDLVDLSQLKPLPASTNKKPNSIFVNGNSNQITNKKMAAIRQRFHHKQLVPVQGKGFCYIKIDTNSFVAND